MKSDIKFYSCDNQHHLRNSRLLGRRKKKTSNFEYSVKCCQPLSVALITEPPQETILLKIKILHSKGLSRYCRFHCFTDLTIYDSPLASIERKLSVELNLSTQHGRALCQLAFHKPFYCPCRTLANFSFRDVNGVVHKKNRFFRIKE
jgi:hypothetical protein